jgi:hypothetical protein
LLLVKILTLVVVHGDDKVVVELRVLKLYMTALA